MPTFNSTQYDLQKTDRDNLSRLAPTNVVDGDVEFAVVPYVIDGTEATSDTINLCVLPQGVIPLPQLTSVTCSADPGTTVTVDIGTAADTDGWGDGLVLGGGGQVWANTPAVPAWQVATPLVADTGSGNAIVKVTCASIASATADVILYFTLAYKRRK